ncbi:MAG: SpoIIE family protein phosphatase [Bacteroidales bacterium]|nr:SpoIIE family protein phosphatase [Bacteroidales bacterium]
MRKTLWKAGLCLWTLLAVFFACNRLSKAQTYYFENYSAVDGLDSKVYAIIQDENRYIWLGTRTGLTRFDGKTFINYATEDGLALLGVRILFIDNNNTLWTGHEGGGITRYDYHKFEKIVFPDTLLKSNITSIVQDLQDQIWVTSEAHGALLIKNPNAPITELNYEHFLKGKKLGDRVYNSLVTSDSSIYFLIGLDIKKYNPTTNDFDSYAPEGMFRFFQFTVMFEDSRKNLWFGTYNGGLHKYNTQTKTFEFYDIKNGLAANWISSITEDRQQNIWVGHWNMDKSQGGISKIGKDKIQIYNTHNGLHDNQIWCIRGDVEGNILIGTTEHGLDIFKGEQFISITTKDGLKSNQVWSIVQDPKGQIWFGTNDGITVYNNDPKNGVFVHYNQSGNFISNQVRFLKEDRENNIWVGTADQGLLLFNTRQKHFISQPQFNSWLEGNLEIRALEIDRNNHLWVGTLDRLVEYDLTKNQYLKTYLQGTTGIPGNDISALFADSKNNLWVGAKDKGIGKISAEGISLINLKADNITPTSVTEDKHGNIWIGTRSKGIYVYHDSIIRQYSVENGLLSNIINVLVIDNKNNVYVGTNMGLNVINSSRNQVFSYTKKNGFTGIETKDNAGLMDINGNIWIGTANGAFLCNTSLGEPVLSEPIIQLTDFSVNRVSRAMQPNLRLRSNENDIIFHFISISLSNPDAVRYRVLLKGLDDEWQDNEDKNTAIYNKLPPGRYTFNVIAKNNEGIWNSIPAQYSFRIMAPPYKRAWFLTMVSLIILSGIIIFIKIRERNLIHEKRVLESRVKERTLALSVANDELAMKNKDILDSIMYAKRIQLSILPPDIPFDNVFILFKPKDIVSGDFYWLTSAGSKEFLAAVDCTGHGVPGAFMSFIGYTSLNKIVIEQGIYRPSTILNRLNEEVAHTLHQKGEDIVNDGMDIALVAYDPATNQLEYSGAFNPLILIRRGEILETKADRFAIGRATGKEKQFTNHTIMLEKNDAIYMFSDGYADQFGGPEGKKFKTAKLKELFISMQEKTMDEQRKILDTTIENWRSGHEQIDDILVMGRKFM